MENLRTHSLIESIFLYFSCLWPCSERKISKAISKASFEGNRSVPKGVISKLGVSHSLKSQANCKCRQSMSKRIAAAKTCFTTASASFSLESSSLESSSLEYNIFGPHLRRNSPLRCRMRCASLWLGKLGHLHSPPWSRERPSGTLFLRWLTIDFQQPTSHVSIY